MNIKDLKEVLDAFPEDKEIVLDIGGVARKLDNVKESYAWNYREEVKPHVTYFSPDSVYLNSVSGYGIQSLGKVLVFDTTEPYFWGTDIVVHELKQVNSGRRDLSSFIKNLKQYVKVPDGFEIVVRKKRKIKQKLVHKNQKGA